LLRKKQMLESTQPLPSGWDSQDRKRLHEAVESVLEEKRKEQLGRLKKRFLSPKAPTSNTTVTAD